MFSMREPSQLLQHAPIPNHRPPRPLISGLFLLQPATPWHGENGRQVVGVEGKPPI